MQKLTRLVPYLRIFLAALLVGVAMLSLALESANALPSQLEPALQTGA